MFNLNIPPSSLLGVEGSGGLCSKPNTPEILNSLIAMTNPLDNYNFSGNNSTASTPASVTVRNFIAQVSFTILKGFKKTKNINLNFLIKQTLIKLKFICCYFLVEYLPG